MITGPRRRRSLSGGAVLLTLIVTALGLAASTAAASGPPIVTATWTSQVASSSARLNARIDPNGLATTYHFDYLTEAAYEANGDTFTGAARIPATDATIGVGNPVSVTQQLFGLIANTTYRYRVVATNSDPASPTTGPTKTFTTQSLGGGALLPDSRGWEMVSPIDKNGGQIDPPGTLAAGGVLQAAGGGDSVTYGSEASFGPGAQGAPPASQYIASRTAGGWATGNITAPIFSSTYDTADQGVPYQLFSPDLARALLLNGDHCRGADLSGCAVANPPLAGTDAPAGYQNYYLRDDASGSFEALLGNANIGFLDISPADFDLRFAGASADLNHVVVSTCAALSTDATEVPQGSGCDPTKQNLYESSGAGLSLLNLLPGQTQGNPGAALGAQSAVVSADGARVDWTDLATGDLYLREGGQTKQVDADAGGGGSFQTATPDGSVAFFTKAGHLWRYDDGTGQATDLTPSGGVVGVLGASDSGSDVYYQDASGLQRWHDSTITQVAPNQASPPASATDPSDYPPTTATARVSADGAKLLFVSTASLTGYDNTDLATGDPDSEVYLYDSTGPTLTCVSCNPTNERPIGPSTFPGAIPNGTAPGSTDTYKPRVLSADGRRVFFDSADSLVLTDTNSNPTTGAGIEDAYQWEASGEGSCARSGGCVALISSGRSVGGATFIDASADGADAFFLTDASLVGADPGSIDLYDARIGGGFPIPSSPIPCEGDACQNLPPEPVDPTLTTLLSGHGNPAVRYVHYCRPGFVKRKGKCVRKHRRHKKAVHRHRSHRHRSGGRG